MSWGFEVGRTYNRRSDIHARFEGQRQGGIITPKAHQLVIIITGSEGEAYGYSDRPRPDGVFEYFGEGQHGDMTIQKGNKAILEHSANGKDLLLFAKIKDGLRFDGTYVCEGVHEEPAPDVDGKMRNALVFELRPLDAITEHLEQESTSQVHDTVADLQTLRDRAIAAATPTPKPGKTSATVFERSKAVRDYVLARAKGACEHCGSPAPFRTPSNQPFLEVHHIRRLTDGGPDDLHHMIGLCPNCHRKAHFAADAEVINRAMQRSVDSIESS